MESLFKLFRLQDLTNFDARVYVKLLTIGPSSPTRLAEELGTHRPQIHGSLKRLASKGFVEVYSGRPATYRAVPPEIALPLISDEFARSLEEVQRFLNSLSSIEAQEQHGVWLYKSSKGLLQKFLRSVEESEIDLVVCGDAVFISRLRDKLLKAQKRGVIVYVLIYEIPGAKVEDVKIEGLLKVKKAVSGDLLVIRDLSLGILAQRRLGAHTFPEYGVLVEEPVLIDYLLQDFFYRWIRSKTIVDEPITPPARFTMFKLALLEVKRILNAGTKLWGKFKGRWIDDGKGVLEGRIVDAIYEPETGIAQIIVESSTGEKYTVGGPDAVIEDFAADEVSIKEV